MAVNILTGITHLYLLQQAHFVKLDEISLQVVKFLLNSHLFDNCLCYTCTYIWYQVELKRFFDIFNIAT